VNYTPFLKKQSVMGMKTISKKSLIMFAILILISSLGEFISFKGIFNYIVPIILWSFVTLLVIYFEKDIYIFKILNSKITSMAFLVAIFTIFLNLDAGLVNKFGKSPVSFVLPVLILNLLMISSNLLGVEVSRSYLLRNLKQFDTTLLLSFMTVFFTFVETSIKGLLTINDNLIFAQYLGETFLPVLASNLLASFLALMGGPTASLAYRAPIVLFQWLSPILPELSWGYRSILGVMIPTIGFSVISASTKSIEYIRAGFRVKRDASVKRGQRSSTKTILAVSFVSVLLVWISTGLLGVYPSVIASGSMQPALNVGDIALSVKVDPDDIAVGDVIQYRKGSAMIIHRVIDTYKIEGSRYVVTKGDANELMDLDPVPEAYIKGRMVFSLPKVGWISIYSKLAIQFVWGLFVGNVLFRSSVVGVGLLGVLLVVYRSRSRRTSWFSRIKGWF